MAIVDDLIKALLTTPRTPVAAAGKTQFEDKTWVVTDVNKPAALPSDVADLYYPMNNAKLTYERTTNNTQLKIDVAGANPRIENLRFETEFEDVIDSSFISIDDEGDFEVKAVSFIRDNNGQAEMVSIVIFRDDEGKLILGNWFCRTWP